MKTTNGIFCASLLWSAVAFGDAMPSCPPGETVQMNPVQPGAFHHAGGKCVPDPTYKPQPEPPKMTPGEVASAKQKLIVTELEQSIAKLTAASDMAKNEAAQAKGTPNEEAKNKAIKEADEKLAAAKKQLDDAQKNPVAPESTPTASKTPNPADTKTGGCAVSQEGSPLGLLLGLLLLFKRRKRTQ